MNTNSILKYLLCGGEKDELTAKAVCLGDFKVCHSENLFSRWPDLETPAPMGQHPFRREQGTFKFQISAGFKFQKTFFSKAVFLLSEAHGHSLRVFKVFVIKHLAMVFMKFLCFKR